MDYPGKGAGAPSANSDANMAELLNLLGPQGGGAPQPQQPNNTAAVAAAAQAAAAAVNARARPRSTSLPAAALSRPTMVAQQPQRRQSVAAPSVVDELQEMLRSQQTQQTTAGARRVVTAPPRNPAYSGGANGVVTTGTGSERSGSSSRPATAAAPRANQHRNPVSQEQVIVGHFCRHALGCMSKLTTGQPNAQELQQSLKNAIKRLWNEWVNERISKTALLETVARFVRQSCPAAANVNVISEFRTWYHQQLTAQRAGRGRQHPNPAAVAARQAGATQTQPTMQNYGYASAAQRAAPGAVPAQNAALALQQGAAMNPAALALNAAMSQKAALVARQRAVAVKAEAKPFANKALPQKTVAAKTVPRTANPQAAALQNAHVAQNAAAAALAAQMNRAKIPAVKARPAMARPKVMTGNGVKDEAILTAMANAGIAGKRPSEIVDLNQMGDKKLRGAVVKSKPSPKGKKSVPGAPVMPQAMLAGKLRQPPPGKTIVMPGALAAHPPHLAASMSVLPTGARPPVVPGTAAALPTPAQDMSKKKKGIDMGLDVVGNIVDIDNEQNKLVGEAHALQDLSIGDPVDYSSEMLLDGPMLRVKIERAMQRFGLKGACSKEIVEMISLAARERLSYVFENVSEMARARVDTRKNAFETRSSGLDVRSQLDKMREDEERSLVVQSELRTTKWRKEQEERAAREAAEKSKDDKSAKDAAAAAEQKKKAKVALEKKRQADSNQRSALSGAISGIGKKRKKKANLAPLMVHGNPSLKTTSGKSSVASSGNAGVRPPGATGATSVPVQSIGTQGIAPKTLVQRPPIKLEDCLSFFSSEPNMRQSALVYKWFARLHAPRQVGAKGVRRR